MSLVGEFALLVFRMFLIYCAVLGLVIAVCLCSISLFRWARVRRHSILLQIELEQLLEEEASR